MYVCANPPAAAMAATHAQRPTQQRRSRLSFCAYAPFKVHASLLFHSLQANITQFCLDEEKHKRVVRILPVFEYSIYLQEKVYLD